MSGNLIPDENGQNSNAEPQKSNADPDGGGDRQKAKAIADEAFARLDPSTRSRLAEDRRAFEESERRLVSANAKRDEIWRDLPEDLQKKLADATRRNPVGSTSEFLDLKPKELSEDAFAAAVRSRRTQLQARVFFYRRRAVCRNFLIDQFLSTCAGSSEVDAPFPAEEFQSQARVLKDLFFCDSVDEATKAAEERWNLARPCVVRKRRRERAARETKHERRIRTRAARRRTFRGYKRSAEWKSYESSAAAIVHALSVSAICVLALWAAILKWDLVYSTRFEKLFPGEGAAYNFLYCMTPFVWLALAFVYRNVVVLRLKFRSQVKEFAQTNDDDV